MLNQQIRPTSSEIEHIVQEIEMDESRFDRELRSVSRQKIILPVSIRSLNGTARVEGFTRNLSGAGVSLISDRSFREGTVARLQIHTQNRSTAEIIGECKWCRPYAHRTFICGWHFLRIASE